MCIRDRYEDNGRIQTDVYTYLGAITPQMFFESKSYSETVLTPGNPGRRIKEKIIIIIF